MTPNATSNQSACLRNAVTPEGWWGAIPFLAGNVFSSMPNAAATANRPLRAPSRPARERILDAAEALFAEGGLAGTSIRDIALRVGVTPGSLYNHFAGKQAIYQAVLERGIRPFFGLMDQLARGEQTADAADEIIGAIMRHLGQHPRLPRLIQHEALTGAAHLTRLAEEWIRPLMSVGIAEIEREPDSPWDPDEFPLVIAAWVQLIVGHFTLSPLLLRDVAPDDPLSEAGLERQTRFLRKFVRILMRARTPREGTPEDPPR
ncbi:MAG: TetR/AcrR family transcriptional regulator [Gemmatimonadetes bacterium]|nr:TetR/AcrR family transcriptional regulator [Gemmatimonadota bacterium]